MSTQGDRLDGLVRTIARRICVVAAFAAVTSCVVGTAIGAVLGYLWGAAS